LQGTVLCCRWQVTRHDALAPRGHNASGRTMLARPAGFRGGVYTPGGTGVEPVTSRYNVWCSASELTALAADTAFIRTHSRNAVQRSPFIKDEPPCAAGTGQFNLA
jgi:hypothetical protein